jgi:hypothetical protein
LVHLQEAGRSPGVIDRHAFHDRHGARREDEGDADGVDQEWDQDGRE